MDPNATLAQLRALMNSHNPSTELQESFEALDEWLSKGGFLPSDWQRESPMIVVGQFPAVDLMHELNAAHKKNGIRKMRVKIEGDQVKFKVNENIWSPPYGGIQETY